MNDNPYCEPGLYLADCMEAMAHFPDGFFDEKPMLYKLEKGNGSRIAMIESPDGTVMELFQFDSMTPFVEPKWNTPGYHHICLEVDNILEKCAAMKADGVEFYFDPDYMGDPADNRYWTFLKDPDGNMIELQGS